MNSKPLLEDTQQTKKKCDKDLQSIFAACFFQKYQVLLVGDANEPLYVPAQSQNSVNYIHYRYDYFSSALHEVAHWCIAGKQRRQKTDYGYWYSPDGRNAEQQQAFEMVEVKPQALEFAFSMACGIEFSVSIDNLNALEDRVQQKRFAQEVEKQFNDYIDNGFPPRAHTFLSKLHEFYSTSPLVAINVI
jgi:elongation factor P hydroxylase